MTEEEKAGFLAQFDQAKKDVERLRQVFPECFGKDGRPIVAELRHPTLKDSK